MELNHEGGPDPLLEHLSTVDDFGLDRKLADFLEMPSGNLDPLVHIIKAYDPDPENPSFRMLRDFFEWNRVLSSSHGYTQPLAVFVQDLVALRTTVRMMLKRRADVLAMESQASQQPLQKDCILSDFCVKRHMKKHRDAFDGSEAQKTMVAWHMQEGKLKKCQAEKCRDNRFTAMLFDKYGGHNALNEVIRTGCLKQIRLGQTHRRLAMRVPTLYEIPPLRPRYIDNKEQNAKEKKSQIRVSYYGNMAGQLQEAGVSTTVQQALLCRRIARIMMRWQEKYLMG